MTGPSPAAAYAALYAPTSNELAAALPEIGEAIAAGLAHLARYPTADGCDRAMMAIEGTRQHLKRLHAALTRDGGGHAR